MKINIENSKIQGAVKIANEYAGNHELNQRVYDSLVESGMSQLCDTTSVKVASTMLDSHEDFMSTVESWGTDHEKIAGLILAAGVENYWNNVGRVGVKEAFEVLKEVHKVGQLSCEIHKMKTAGEKEADELDKINKDYLVELVGRL